MFYVIDRDIFKGPFINYTKSSLCTFIIVIPTERYVPAVPPGASVYRFL